jgi:hypothetical protein
MRKRIGSLLVALVMVLTLLPTAALAVAAPSSPPRNLKFEGGQEWQTLPSLTWDALSDAENYYIYASKDGSSSLWSGGSSEASWPLDVDAYKYANNSNISYDTYIVSAVNYDDNNVEYETKPTKLSCNVQITNVISSESVTAIYNSATVGSDTWALYTISGLPANTTVRVGSRTEENGQYTSGNSDTFEINRGGVLLIPAESYSDWPEGPLGLADGAVAENEHYYLTTYTDTNVSGTGVSFTQTTYPISFVFDKTWDATQTLTFQNSGTQTVSAGKAITNTVTNNQSEGGSITYYDNCAGSRIDPDSGEVTALLPYEEENNYAVICAFAAATEKYPAAIASYELTIMEPVVGEQTMSWDGGNDGLTATYGGTVTGKTAATNSGGGTITYASSNTDVATVDNSTGAVTIVGVGDATITATAAEVANTYRQTSIAYTLTVNKKPVTVTAADKSRAFGDQNPEFTLKDVSSVLVSGDSESDLGVTLSTAAVSASDVGTYDITGTSESANYDVTVNKGTLIVTKAGVPTVSNITKNLLYSSDPFRCGRDDFRSARRPGHDEFCRRRRDGQHRHYKRRCGKYRHRHQILHQQQQYGGADGNYPRYRDHAEL